MKKFIAILLCKITKSLASLLGRGSSLPGKLALKVCPDIISRIKLPENIVAVTGSNGKTSTTEMIYEILRHTNKSVVYNREGSNQIEGVTTLLLCNSTLFGRFKEDILLLEVDERYAQYVFKYLYPKYYVINNLYRDQMTRNGHPEFVLNEIKKSIRSESELIINSDDPLVASLGLNHPNNVYYFGIDDNDYTSEDCNTVYDDGYYCPICKSKMVYEYRHFSNVGKYHCINCDFRRIEPEFCITNMDLRNSKITINNRYEINLAQNAINNAYNILAAFAAGFKLGANEEVLINSLNNYLIKNGRIRRFKIGDKSGTLLISKHENTTSYNNNLEYIINQNTDTTLLLIIDDISRKYFTSDTSWLWDINFELLKNKNIKRIIVGGKYIWDVATRFKYAGIDADKVIYRKDVDIATSYLRYSNTENIYTMTCFSDEAKFLKEVTQL